MGNEAVIPSIWLIQKIPPKETFCKRKSQKKSGAPRGCLPRRLPAVPTPRSDHLYLPQDAVGPMKLCRGKGFVFSMNANFYRSFVTPPGIDLRTHTAALTRFCTRSGRMLNSKVSAGYGGKYKRFGKALKVKLSIAIYSLAVLVCGLLLALAPTRAQSVTASTYLNNLYNWWKRGSAENDFQQITAHAMLDSFAQRIRH